MQKYLVLQLPNPAASRDKFGKIAGPLGLQMLEDLSRIEFYLLGEGTTGKNTC